MVYHTLTGVRCLTLVGVAYHTLIGVACCTLIGVAWRTPLGVKVLVFDGGEGFVVAAALEGFERLAA